MTAYAGGRYRVSRDIGSESVICQDVNLDRTVCIHWVPGARRETVRARLAALQAVRSPYVALIYDLVEAGDQVGVVQEELAAPIAPGDPRRLLYQFCAGLAALHENHLAHGALDENSFRADPLGHGRLCNLAFSGDHLDDPSADRQAFLERLRAMGAPLVQDPIFQELWRGVATGVAAPGPHASYAGMLRDRLAALLLVNQHRALAQWRGMSIEMGAQQRLARFEHPHPGVVARATVEYDGTRFFFAEASGEVRVNNRPVSPGDDLPGSCVIALGDRNRPWHDRYFITFDQSHPEVT